MKKLILAASCMAVLAGCNDADIASSNLSKAADNFQIQRRIVFYNTQSDTIMLTIEGLCSLGNQDKSGELSVVCKTGPTRFHKEFLGLSRNVTYVVQQLEDASVSDYHYKAVWKPAVLVPNIEIK
ncbi:lipoprotein [Caballeronia sp. LZ032]|uniref:beta-sandwich lipoprotein n=1 Tax=Caballeronia sp. LZ032 TaxID=3038565 RepID=UPI00285D2E1A|nr:lipoprotein [Caballeronia sp. LZ032]MDR5881078.1 lipoprotein [Caballeronia sp. LZ032]